MKKILRLCLLAIAPSLAGQGVCSAQLIPSGSIELSSGYAVTYASMVQVGILLAAVYLVSDPLAPVWEITETRLPDQRVFYKLDKRFLSLGGDGEARQVLARRAEALAAEQGMAGYQIQRFEESVDSRILLPRRTVFAEVRLLASK